MKEFDCNSPGAEAITRAARVLYEAGARAVWLFGSRGRGRAPDRLTDVDLCVEGLAPGMPAIECAAAQLRGRVDIIPMEGAPPPLRSGISDARVFVPWVEATSRGRARLPLPDSLAGMRTRQVARVVRESGTRSVIEFGCGYGWLLAELAADEQIEKLTGVDFDPIALAAAKRRLARACGPRWQQRVTLHYGLITHRDRQFSGHDTAAAVEVIEHLELPQLKAFEHVLFEFARPGRVLISTPNSEYNVVWQVRRPHGRRHPDHRFEWSRAQFADWAAGIERAWGYRATFEAVGTPHPEWGPPTQLALFERDRAGQP